MSEVFHFPRYEMITVRFHDPLVTTSLEFAESKFELGVHNVEKYMGANLRSCKRTYKLPNGETVTNCNQLKLLAADGKSARAEFSALVTCAGSNFRLGVLNYLKMKPVWKKVTWRKFALCEIYRRNSQILRQKDWQS